MTQAQHSRLITYLAATVFTLSLSGLAHAQQAAPAPAPAADDENAEAEIIVTGTAIRGVAPVGSATVNISRDTILQSGLRDSSALIAQLPQGSSLGTTLGNSGGRSAGVNLRGLGNNATLLLFDSHRTVTQGVQNLVPDPNTIPFSAIERVEVVTDGASAIYGSDAVAGVVNYIFRRPFDGAEVTARYTTSIYDQAAVDAVLSRKWNGGGVLLAFGYEGNSRITQGSIPSLRADLRAFGGNDSRLQGTVFNAVGQNGALLQGNTVYGLPSNLNGRTPTTAEVQALRGNPSLVDSSDFQDYYTARTRYSVMARVMQDLGDLGDVSLTAMFNRRTNAARGQGDGAFQSIAIAIPSTSPYFVPGLGSGSQSIVYNFRLNNPDRALNRNDYENTHNVLFDYKVGLFSNFRLTVGAGWGVSQGCAVCQPQANTILTSFIARPENAAQFNPYVQGPQPSAEKIFGIFVQRVRNEMIDFLPKIDGTLFNLPGGAVRIAVGGEWTKSYYKQQSDYSLNPTTTQVIFRFANSNRTVSSAFGEVFVPIFGDDNATTLFRKLDLSAAIRHDRYSDFGSTTNPKFGLTWKPIDDLQLRGSYGTSFRAPTLAETNFNVVGAANRTFLTNNLGNPQIPISNASNGTSLFLVSTFRFAQLRPETADIFSLGADYSPSYIPGLKLGTTYYNVVYRDRISALPATNSALTSAANFALYQPFITLAPQPNTCVNGSVNGNPGAPEYNSYNPAYLKFLNAPGSYPPTTANDCQLVGILNAATSNLGQVKQSGIDFNASYVADTGIGTINLNGAFTKILKLQRNLLPGAPIFDALNRIGEQIGNRGRFAAGLTNGGFSGLIAANYIGGYLNNLRPTVAGVRLPDDNVPSWTTVDLTLTYAFQNKSGMFAGTRFTINAQNVTNKQPPLVLSTQNTGGVPTATDLNVHNVFGRIVTFEISKAF